MPHLHSSRYFHHLVHVGLNQVDFAGVIFFSRIYEMAQFAFESFFLSDFSPNSSSNVSDKIDGDKKTNNLARFIQQENLFPLVVHAEADYYLPIKYADELDIFLHCEHLGRTSFLITYHFFLNDRDAAKSFENNDKKNLAAFAKIIHVLVDADTKKPHLITDAWRQKLSSVFVQS